MTVQAISESCDLDRRQGGVARLYGPPALERLRRARVMVIGIGGVGSWAVEALARSGVGALDLVDLDHVAESNINRQVHALDTTLGQAKVDAMAARIAAINPACRVRALDRFAEVGTFDALLDPAPDLVIDAIDQAAVKVALIAWCKHRGLPLVVCGAAGGKTSPVAIRVDDLARTTHDVLLAKVRTGLRRDHGFTRTPGRRFGVTAVFSIEPTARPLAACDTQVDPDLAPQGLSCAGYGSSVCVTASFGLFAAAAAIEDLVRTPAD